FEGFIVTITLNKPNKLNALIGDDLFELGSHLEDIAERDDIFATVTIGNGWLFSPNVKTSTPDGNPVLEAKARNLPVASYNIRNCKAFYEHPKILIRDLNGPVIGYPICLIAFADIIFAVENAYLATPSVSLGLVAEGVSSFTFTKRLGMTKANEALILENKSRHRNCSNVAL
ncbi:ClpP/crotonase-like domain-containing protein, partial [Phaeosphaeriaceae sp. PMI808]